MKLEVKDTLLAGLVLIERPQIDDQRGHFSRVFCTEQMASFGWPNGMMQSNFSVNNEIGTVRGLHFQYPPHAEAKVVTCISGAIMDVAVDLRFGSASFGEWYSVELSETNCLSLLIPQGFAHGYQVLESNSSMLYFHSAAYNPEAEGGICWDDPTLAIKWPLAVRNVSQRDQAHSALDAIGKGIEL